MTPVETISENASGESMLADGQNDADVSAKSVEKIDEVINRAFDELDKLSASLISKREAFVCRTDSRQARPVRACQVGEFSLERRFSACRIKEASFEEGTASSNAGLVDYSTLRS